MMSDFKTAIGHHKDYTRKLEQWQSFRKERSQKIALWSSLFWTFQNAKHGDEKGLDVNRQSMRLAVDIPGESDWDEWIAGVVGFDKEETTMSELISGKTDIELLFDKAKDDEDWPFFVKFGRKIRRKRLEVENSAQYLHNYMFFGDISNSSSDIDDGERCKFQKKFAKQNYETQVALTKKLTKNLGKSQFGREIISKLINPHFDKSSRREYFTALSLFYPHAVWSGKFQDPLVDPPKKSKVGNKNSVLGGTKQQPYVKDVKLADKLTVLAGQLMPGVSYFQAKQDGDLWAANTQMSSFIYMIDGGISQQNWKAFREYGRTYGSSEEDEVKKTVKVFSHLATAVQTADSVIPDFESQSNSRYSGGNNYSLYRSSFTNLISLIGSTAGIVAKANEDELDFSLPGVYAVLQGFHTSTELYTDLRKMYNMEYDSVDIKNGKFVKSTSSEGTKWGSTLLDAAGKAFDVMDAFLSTWTALNASEKGEYDVAVLAGTGAIIALTSLFVGGWPAALLALAGMIVAYLTDWVTDSSLTNWMERTVFGKKQVSNSTNTDPTSPYFGYQGYKRVQSPNGWTGTDGGLSRQIAGFHSIIKSFSAPDKVPITENSGEYSLHFNIEDITGGGINSGFIFQPIYKHNGEHKVGSIAHDVAPVTRRQGDHQGVSDQSWGDIELDATAIFPPEKGKSARRNKVPKWESVPLIGTDMTLRASSKSDLLGFDPSNSNISGPYYLELLHVPGNFRSSVASQLKNVADSPSKKFIDTVVDLQPFPRQRVQVSLP